MELVPILIVLFTLGLILLVEKMHHPVLQQMFDWLPPILLAYLAQFEAKRRTYV